MVRADRAELGKAVHLQPGEEVASGDAVGGACVRFIGYYVR